MSFRGAYDWLSENASPYIPGSGSFGEWGGSGRQSDSKRRRNAAELVQNPNYGDMGVPGFDRQFNRFREMSFGRSGYEGSQRGLGNILQQEAMGNGVGQQLVRMQAQQAADRASAQQFAALGGARPGMQAMASRNAMLGSALAQSAVGEQAAMGSANMTLGAQGQYGNFLQGARGQDIAQQGQNLAALNSRAQLASMQQQGNQFNANLGQNRWLAAYGVGPDQRPSRFDKAAGFGLGALSAYNMMNGSGG